MKLRKIKLLILTVCYVSQAYSFHTSIKDGSVKNWVFNVGEPIQAFIPVNTGKNILQYEPAVIASESKTYFTDNITRYTISPQLPAGLVLDSITGIISGTPICIAESEDYTVIADRGKRKKSIGVMNFRVVDSRDISNSIGTIPDDNYCDQGYVVVTPTGKWVSVMTTGPGSESGFKYIVSSISCDLGKSWTSMQPIDDKTLSTAWAIPYITPAGRIYVFYNRNRRLCFKYSDDGGLTWSKNRYEIPIRYTDVDERNDLPGKQQYFWSVCKPISLNSCLYLSFSKYAFKNMDFGEGWLLRSPNIDTISNPDKIIWEMLPDGNEGIRNDTLGKVQEEHTLVSLPNGSLYLSFRTNNGYVGCCYSHDGGHTWTSPQYACYRDGSKIKNPRACPRLFQCDNGRYLMWIHNTDKVDWWNYRNPAWIIGGIAVGNKIEWSYPEILFYSNDTTEKISYPDLIKQNDNYWMTETQKTVCGVHKVSEKLLQGIWNQNTNYLRSDDGIIMNDSLIYSHKDWYLKNLPELGCGAFSIEMLIRSEKWNGGDIIADNRDENGDGFWISVTSGQTVRFSMRQGRLLKEWDIDSGLLKTNTPQHIVFIIDGISNIITSVVNGKFCDGGITRKWGWCRFDKHFGDLNSSRKIVLSPSFSGEIIKFKIYNRYLTTSEAIGHYRYETFFDMN